MNKSTLLKLETLIETLSNVDDKKKLQILKLVEQLRKEMSGLPESHREKAQSIAGFAELAAHEATRKEKSPELLKHSLGGLSSSVQGFEASHPQLVGVVNEIANLLSSIGI